MNNLVDDLKASPEFAEEMLVADIQSYLEQLLDEKGCSRTDLARRMGVSKARVSQIFSDQQNFTVRLLARAFHALGEEVRIVPACLLSQRNEIPDFGDIEVKSMKEIGLSDLSGISIPWELPNIDGIIGNIDANQDFLAHIRRALKHYSGQSTENTKDSEETLVKDWETLGNNVIPIRKEVANG